MTDRACPTCQKMGRDKNSDHLFLMADGITWHCNRCKHTETSEVLEKKEEKTISLFNVEDIKKAPVYEGAEIRGIKNSIRSMYGCRVWCDESTGEPSTVFYPKADGYKVRKLPKTFTATKGTGSPSLFGKELTRSQTLVITGGEEDAMAAYQMLNTAMPHSTPACVSLPDGEGSFGAISKDLDYIMSHKRIILCLDMDEAGEAGTSKLAALLEGQVRVAKLPAKDPNECLLSGMEKEFVEAIQKAKRFSPEGILTVDDVFEDAIKMPEWGRHWPWPSLDKLTYGRRNGEGIYVGAGTKIGKTEWLSQMVHHITEIEGKKVMLFKFEQGGGDTVKAIAGKIMNKRFNIPDGDFTQEELTAGVGHVKDKVFMFDAYMSGGNESMWDRMKPVIRHAVIVEGVEDIFIDPITQLTDGLTAQETDVELRRMSNQLASMALELGFFYYCFCHLKAPAQGKTHEEGAVVRVAQFRGSRAMMEKTKYALGLSRDMYAEDEAERNTTTAQLLLASGVGRTGSFPLVYDDVTGSYLEPKNDYA